MRYLLFTFAFAIFFVFPSFADAQTILYSYTATSSSNTTNKVEIPIDCAFVNGDISRVDLFYQKRNGTTATTTLAWNGVVMSTTTATTGDAVYRWYEHTLSSSVPCSSGYATITLESSLTSSGGRHFIVRGDSATTTVQYSRSKYSYPTVPTISYTPTSTAIILYSDGTPPPTPPTPPTPPPPILPPSITRTSTTTCDTIYATSTLASTTCTTIYIPEVYFLDWIFVNMMIIFLLSFTVIGFFMNRTLKQ